MNTKEFSRQRELIMKFKSERDKDLFMRTVAILSEFVPRGMKELLERRGFQVKEKEKESIAPVYEIKSDLPYSLEFHFQDLFLQIALKDRNATEWEADEKLSSDFDYFIDKTDKMVCAKIDPITIVMANEDNEAKKVEEYIDLRLEELSTQGLHERDRRFMEVICILNQALCLGIEHLEFRETVNAKGE